MSHARLGPSNHRWPNCPGSVREEAQYEDIPGEAAIDGTGSHLLLEMCLANNVPAIQYDQQIIGVNHEDSPSGWLVGLDRIERVQMCLDYVARRVGELSEQYPNSKVTVEAEGESNPGAMFGRADWWGTVDITITCRDNHTGEVMFLEVIDYKDGRGWVHVTDNTQLLSYLIGKLRNFVGSGPDLVRPFLVDKVKNCRITIVQPKTNPVVRYQCSTVPEDSFSTSIVLEHASRLNLAAHATDKPDAPLIDGKWCQWCKANPKRDGHCTAAVDKSIQVVNIMSNTDIGPVQGLSMFEHIGKVITDPTSLSSSELSELLSAKAALMAAFDKCEAEIVTRLNANQEVPGYAMVPGRGKRVWNGDDDEIIKKLKAKRVKLDDIYPKKLVTPAALLKSNTISKGQKKKIEDELISFVAGDIGLSKVAHKEIEQPEQAIQDMFADVQGTTGDIDGGSLPAPELPSFF